MLFRSRAAAGTVAAAGAATALSSAGLGLATMAMRASAGEAVPGSDLLIQVVALVLFGGLLWRDRGVVDDRSDLR